MDGGQDRALEWIEHCAEPGSQALPPGAQAILERVVRADRERVWAALSVLDEADNIHAEEIGLEYWVPTGRAIPRRVRLCGGIEPEPASGDDRTSWVGCAQDVTDAYLAARALSALEAGEHALAQWRSFAPSLEELLRRVALALDSPRAVAWTRGASGRLEVRVRWSAADATPDPAQTSAESAVAAQHRPLARMAWVGGGAVATNLGFGVPATWHGNTVAVLTFESRGPAFLDDGLAGSLRWLGSALGRRLTGDRPEVGETRLSDREREVLQLAADGYDGPAIAQHLFVSPATVKTHFIHVYEKLGVNDRSAAVARALRQGLIA
jgi:DNA-binding CsgD family transcriptional regulator